MKKVFFTFTALALALSIQAQGYSIGDKAADFNLKNVDGKMVSLKDYADKKGVVVIFTCNHCPYSVLYEDRIVELDKEFKAKGFPVVAINPNDPELYESDSYENMIVRAKEKGFTFPYLFDDGQKVFPLYGATKTPHVYVLNNDGGTFKVAYIGAIDDNSKNAGAVKDAYLKNAINSLLKGKTPSPATTKAIGCGIKVKS